MNDQLAVPDDANAAELPRKGPAFSRPCLTLCSGPADGQRFELDPGTAVIGRMPAAQVHVQGQGVSRQHADLQVSGGRVLLRDLGSANGTQVSGQRVSGPVALQDGDLIRVGSVVLRFHAPGA